MQGASGFKLALGLPACKCDAGTDIIRFMQKKDTLDVMTSAVALVVDALAILGGFMLATWIRFDSGWVPIQHGRPEPLYLMYSIGAAVATVVFLLVFRSLGLFVRPQIGSFPSKIPRIVKGAGLGTLLTMVLAFSVRHEFADFSRLVIGAAFLAISFFLVLERYILFRIEWNLARHSKARNSVLILGTDSVAAHVKRTLQREPMFRCNVIGFLRANPKERDESIPQDDIRGSIEDLSSFVESNRVDQVILTSSSLKHEQVVEIIMLCERNLITFNMVPDMFRILTSSMDVQSLEDIPLLGIGRWPLDFFWNRAMKRIEDIIGGIFGFVITLPVITVAGVMIKLTSAGPVFFRQERCGEHGKLFMLYKLRTMVVDAEEKTGPVFAKENDPRTTKVGAFLRKHNIDELPQIWNVLKGDMSLVGPRPERPCFVEKFKEDINRYMWRHVSKPGMTGWAQVNGLRGNTSIDERIKYDLYYLENWSLAFDFKILMRTIFAQENAY